MVSISVLLCTARDNYPVIGLPTMYVFETTFNSLLQQTFKDFEVVVVDALYPNRKEFLNKDWGFPVKYVPPHPNHRFWLDKKRWNICGQLNTGLLYCEGELIVRIDDCSEFDCDFLQRFWDGYKSGYFPLAMHIRYLEGKPARFDEKYREKGYEAHFLDFEPPLEERFQILKRIYGDEGLIRDTRYPVVKSHGGKMIAPPEWFYGYSSCSLDALLKVNGYNELFDGDKGQEDQECGVRLSMAGYRNMFLLNIDHQVIEHEHNQIPETVISRHSQNIKCNYAILQVYKKKGLWKANSELLTEQDLKFIIDETLKPPCSPREGMYEDDCKGDLFKLWSNHQPIFNLREERMEI